MDDSVKTAHTQNNVAGVRDFAVGTDHEPTALRLLLIAPEPSPGRSGGMDVAVANVTAELERRGWIVDRPLGTLPHSQPGEATAKNNGAALHGRLSIDPPPILRRLNRSRLRSRIRLPEFLRGYLGLLVDRPTIQGFNENLLAVQRVLDSATRPDAVLLFSGYATPGICSLALASYPATVLVSTAEPALELKLAWAWALARRFWSWRLRGAVHPFIYRAASAEQMKCVVFVSEGWKQEAVRRGLSETSARTIYFGVPRAPAAPRAAPRGKLLYVGRMNRDKGPRQFVEAMPAILAAMPAATLTIIARTEDDAYRASIAARIEELQLTEAIKVLPHISRAELDSAYSSHDALIYSSPFREPVPLVMMDAFTAGLPVIIARPRSPSPLVQPERTCLCFDPAKPATLVAAIESLHNDAALRQRLTANARALVEGPFSLDSMGEQYDALLRTVASGRPRPT